MILFTCQSCGYSDYVEDITDSYQCPKCQGLMKNKERGEINMKKFFNRVRSYISDHFTCSNPSCGYETYVKVIGNTYKCPECGGTMYRD